MITIAVDMMGGDAGLEVTIPAVLSFLKKNDDVHVVLTGEVERLQEAFSNEILAKRVTLVPTTEVVAMDESPQLALKNKKNSSMRVAINQIKEGRAQAAVSAGNTGALMATARFVLKTLPGINRPAIAKFLPTQQDFVCALDLGANVDCSAEQLRQFAVLGAQLAKVMQPEKTKPRVALLNVGSEEIKGGEKIRTAYQLLQESSLNFIGNIEGNEIFSGKADVVVCDGFVGNVLLKTIEGTVRFFATMGKNEIKRSWYVRWVALWALPIVKRFKRKLDPRRYNGAIFLGLRGIVVKSHGGTDDVGFYYALQEAYIEAQADIMMSLEEAIAQDNDAQVIEQSKYI